MDQELFQENALRETFAELQKWRQEAGIPDNDDEQVFFGPADMDEEEMDLHLMSNLLQSHAEGMGMPQGPVHALLSQLGISLPKVPSTHSP